MLFLHLFLHVYLKKMYNFTIVKYFVIIFQMYYLIFLFTISKF